MAFAYHSVSPTWTPSYLATNGKGGTLLRVMEADLASQLDRARIEARRRRHDAALPEHLLVAVIEDTQPDAQLRHIGIDPSELRERLGARLDTLREIGGYRDGSEVPISADLTRVIDRVDVRGWRRFHSNQTVVDALLLEPAIASLVFELRRGNDHRHVVHRARALAIISGHASVELEHFFQVFLDLRSFAETVARAGGDVDKLRYVVDDAVAEHPRGPPSRDPPVLARAVREVIASAEASSRNETRLRPFASCASSSLGMPKRRVSGLPPASEPPPSSAPCTSRTSSSVRVVSFGEGL
jgi:ATP-dependent Clp protease ATP-binding subunit ClpA